MEPSKTSSTVGARSRCRVSDSYHEGCGFDTHPDPDASNLEQVAYLLCGQANPAFYPQWDGRMGENRRWCFVAKDGSSSVAE